ncbi:hypothetical protein Q8W71_25180, partial [Methylobacterium sp. NEAU 140]|uniref:hypothetical protein n=1 Tax=Methylobacterium sp. NEAU 140 TaxID=3064945 RepID=UPI002734D4F1
ALAPAPVPVPAAPPRQAARVESRPAARPAASPAPNGDKRGWLSDLLSRASLDDEDEAAPAAPAQGQGAREGVREGTRDGAVSREQPASRETPQNAAETGRIALDTISTDIARMLDHRTAVDLWERYRRGEPNLFDPRIYTPQGRATFAEIQRRYRSDAEFRRSVDRYVGEFERLLGDVVKNDRDAKRTDAYLTSETGKVYTMLAHASGRFDGA